MPPAANYKVTDKRIDYKAGDSRLYQTGPPTVTLLEVTSANNSSLNQARFTIFAGNYDTGISRYTRIRMRGSCVIHLVGDAAAAATARVAFATYPLHARAQTITTVINNTTITVNDVYRQIDAAQFVNTPSMVANSYLSPSPTQPDIFNSHRCDTSNGSGIFATLGDGALGDGVDQTRYTFKSIQRLPNNATAARAGEYLVEFDICEPVLCPPFVGDDSYIESLVGINQIEVTYNFDADFKKMFATSLPIYEVRVVPNTVTYSLLTSTMTSKYPVERPLRVRYNCPKIDYSYMTFNSGPAAINDVSGACQTPDRQLSSIPRYIILWATPKDDFYTDATAGQWARVILPIESIDIKFGAKSGLLANLAPQQLYEISKQSGLDADFNKFVGKLSFGGGVADENRFNIAGGLNACPVVIDVAQFLSLPDDAAVGCRYQTAFSAKVTYRNNLVAVANANIAAIPSVSLATGAYVHTLIVYDQELIIENGNSALLEGVASPEELRNAPEAPQSAQQAAASTLARAGVYGGSFFDNLFNIGKKILPAVGDMAGEAVGIPGLGSLASGLLGAGAGSNTGGARMTRGAMLKMQK